MFLPILQRNPLHCLPEDQQLVKHGGLRLLVGAREGVGHAWLVDPTLETLEVFRLHEGHWLLVLSAGGTDTVRAEPFDAVEIDLAGLWIPKG